MSTVSTSDAPATVDRLLPPEVEEALLGLLVRSRDAFQPARIVPPGESAGRLHLGLRRGLVLREIGTFAAVIEDALREVLPTLCERLGEPPFTPARIDMEASQAGDGDFFAMHTDDYLSRDRRLTAVLHLHGRPRRFTGGELRMVARSDDGALRQMTTAPLSNRLVAFPSRWSHEVLPVRVPSGDFADGRFAVTSWLYG